MSGVRVRLATVDDLAAIRRIGEVTWPVTYPFASAAYLAHAMDNWWSLAALAESLARTRTFVAEASGPGPDREVVGVGAIDLCGDRQDVRPGDWPSIWKFYLLPEYQGRGVGRLLLDRLLAQVPPAADGVMLEYIEGNERGAAFFRRHGFAEFRRDPPGRPDWPACVWMARPAPRRPDAAGGSVAPRRLADGWAGPRRLAGDGERPEGPR
ncbi:MAG: GNAT family N-acetyltransferase [Actinomycetia bacterium]|nr:GNAT family N-acetyltransferase [Actinomycetes bacterium]